MRNRINHRGTETQSNSIPFALCLCVSVVNHMPP
jgi:hypothetical protein